MQVELTGWQHFESPGAPLVVDAQRREALVGGRTIPLTDTECRLLLTFIDRRGSVVSRDQALAAVWGRRFRGCRRAVDVYVGRLRAKLRDAAVLETERGAGYRLV